MGSLAFCVSLMGNREANRLNWFLDHESKVGIMDGIMEDGWVTSCSHETESFQVSW